MKTNRIIAIIAAVALTVSVSAQQAMHDNYAGINLGGGLNTMLYKTANGQNTMGAGMDAGLFYSRFFTPTVGLGVGLQYSLYNANALYNYSETTPGLTHPSNPNQTYNLTTSYNNWVEHQTVGVMSIPVEVLFRAPISDRWAFIGGVGASLDLPLHANYSPRGGDYTNVGVFPALGNYVVRDLPEHGFGTYSNIQGGNIANRASVGASVLADAGCRLALNDNWGLYLGLYFGYGVTNLLAQAKTDPLLVINASDPTKIDYAGTFGSNEVSKANLLRFGLKVAIDFGWDDKVKAPEPEPVLEPAVDSAAIAREKAHAAFEQYKQEQSTVCAGMAEPDDSDACKALIAKAQRDIAALQYDDNLSEEQNRARVDAIVEQLRKDLAAQRERDRQAREAAEQAAEQAAKEEAVREHISEINVYFENNALEPTISEEERALLEQLCEMMKADSNLRVVVVGHTDNYGDPEQNLRYYGMKRAEGLKAYMVRQGVPAEQIRCESRGDKEPVAPNDSRANRAKNRRANIRFE